MLKPAGVSFIVAPGAVLFGFAGLLQSMAAIVQALCLIFLVFALLLLVFSLIEPAETGRARWLPN
jgi:uncharacterized membrane protein YtjA (UPF0391 family)